MAIPVVFIAVMCLVSQLRTVPLPAMTSKEWPLSDAAWAGSQQRALRRRAGFPACRACHALCTSAPAHSAGADAGPTQLCNAQLAAWRAALLRHSHGCGRCSNSTQRGALTLPRLFVRAHSESSGCRAQAVVRAVHQDPVVLLSPDTPEVRRISALLATALVCDGSRPRPPGVQDAFGGLWRRGLPPECGDAAYCTAHRNCTARMRTHQLAWASHRSEVDAALRGRPGAYAAAVEFDPVDTLSYTVRMNHTQLPPTNRLFSDINVGSLKVTGEPDADWKRYFFGANLQLAVDRSLAALRLGTEAQGPLDVQVHVRHPPCTHAPRRVNFPHVGATKTPSWSFQVKAFPWPAHQLNVGGVLAGILFNFLLVFAFILPTCAIVSVIVHEKELQLRGYMRVLGLLDAAYWGSWFVTHMAIMCFTGLLCAVIGMCAPPLATPACSQPTLRHPIARAPRGLAYARVAHERSVARRVKKKCAASAAGCPSAAPRSSSWWRSTGPWPPRSWRRRTR